MRELTCDVWEKVSGAGKPTVSGAGLLTADSAQGEHTNNGNAAAAQAENGPAGLSGIGTLKKSEELGG